MVSNQLIQSLFLFLKLILAYLLMLIVMTYNVLLLVAVVFGLTAGYAAFGFASFKFGLTGHNSLLSTD